MRALAMWIGFTIGNFTYQWATAQHYDTAAMLSFYQGVAILAMVVLP